MSYYGGTVTVGGRNMLAGLLKGGTISFTKVLVGSGKLAEGEIPLDRTELVHPVAQATSTPPIVEDGICNLTVEYRNDMNGGLEEMFWLNEFGIFAKTDETEETLFYYATLGDSPQPVNKYAKDRVDIRRYPITIAIEADAEVRVLYDMSAFVTSEDVLALVKDQIMDTLSSGAILPVYVNLVIPKEGWKEADPADTDNAKKLKYIDIPTVGLTEDSVPNVALKPKSLDPARECGLCHTCLAKEGALRVYSLKEPSENLEAGLTMHLSGINLRGDWTHVDPDSLVDWSKMPVATETTLGGVKIGENVRATDEGVISVDSMGIVHYVKASTEAVGKMVDDVLGPQK